MSGAGEDGEDGLAKVISTEVRKRGFFGKVRKWLFIIFNILMCAWLISYWTLVGGMMAEKTNQWEQAGATIGATMGTGALIAFWFAGAAILAGLAMATRGKKIITQETIK